jgi:hypothetical protein
LLVAWLIVAWLLWPRSSWLDGRVGLNLPEFREGPDFFLERVLSQPMFIIRHPRHRTSVHTDAVTISSGTPGAPIITAILDQPPGHEAPLNCVVLF